MSYQGGVLSINKLPFLSGDDLAEILPIAIMWLSWLFLLWRYDDLVTDHAKTMQKIAKH
jgi:hypothetical protein